MFWTRPPLCKPHSWALGSLDICRGGIFFFQAISSFLLNICFPAYLWLFCISFVQIMSQPLSLRYVSDQLVSSARTQTAKCRRYRQWSQTSEVHDLLYNPGINKKDYPDWHVSSYNKRIVSNLLIWDFSDSQFMPFKNEFKYIQHLGPRWGL